MALDLLVELEIVKAKDRVTSPRRSPTDEARRCGGDARRHFIGAVAACSPVVAFPRRGQALDDACGAVAHWWRRTHGDAVT